MRPDGPEAPLRLLMLSIHGFVRGSGPELGRDADTGGQVRYVLELARALGRRDDVGQVDVVTRLIEGDAPDYARPAEPIGPKARILRLPFGPRRYLRKELLWPHLDQLVDACLQRLGTTWPLPHLVHGHYADAGWVATQLSHVLGVPLVHTGHSLGRMKKRRLLAAGRKEPALEKQFHFERRIAAEEETLEAADLVVASTREEVEEQWAAYENFAPAKFRVLPPGVDTSRFSPPKGRVPLASSRWVDRFLERPGLPMILAICRPEPKKNLARLLEAYAGDGDLVERANLVVVAGTRDDLSKAEETPREVLTELLFLIDRYDLWGKVAFPKTHVPEQIPDLYRIAVKRRGVFVNPAVTEPFGLTLLEAAASGLPVVATRHGGPRDIVETCRNGVLVDPLDPRSIAEGLKALLFDPTAWRHASQRGVSGVARHYSWDGHVASYVRACRHLLHRERKRLRKRVAARRDSEALLLAGRPWALVTDIDDTLVGDAPSLRALLEWLSEHAEDVIFGVATGRTLARALERLREWGVPVPDVLISSVGTEIVRGRDLARDPGWSKHISLHWRRDAVEETLRGAPGLTLQAEENQGAFKLSFNVIPARMEPLEALGARLRARRLRARFVFSQSKYLDVLPVRASKGLAIRYLSRAAGLPLSRFLVAGDSGNDVEMLLGDTLGIVVGNHKPELEELKGRDKIYFARAPYAGGILEGIRHYGFGGVSVRPAAAALP